MSGLERERYDAPPVLRVSELRSGKRTAKAMGSLGTRRTLRVMCVMAESTSRRLSWLAELRHRALHWARKAKRLEARLWQPSKSERGNAGGGADAGAAWASPLQLATVAAADADAADAAADSASCERRRFRCGSPSPLLRAAGATCCSSAGARGSKRVQSRVAGFFRSAASAARAFTVRFVALGTRSWAWGWAGKSEMGGGGG